MRSIILTILLLCTTLSYSVHNENPKKEIFTLNFSDSNTKKLIVSKKNNQYIFKAYNNNSEIQSCKWVTKINNKQASKLKESITFLIKNRKYENHSFKLIKKKSKIILIFKESRCISKHKLYYFQKDCQREFKISLPIQDFEKLCSKL